MTSKPLHADLHHVLEWAGVDLKLQAFIADCGEEGYPERWHAIRSNVLAELRAMIGPDGPDAETVLGARSKDQHLLNYIQLVVASEVIDKSQGIPIPADQKRRVQVAAHEYNVRHLRLDAEYAHDYAHGLKDVRDRVLFGARTLAHMSVAQTRAWGADVDAFDARVARHEYPLDDAIRVLEEARAAVRNRVDVIRPEIAKLQATLSRYNAGPAHVYALEQQWAAYKFSVAILHHDKHLRGALQPATAEALRVAETYCWAPSTVEAVAGVAAEIPGECTLTPTALGDLSAPSRAGWWWFQEPLPIKTTSTGHEREPVVAMLWRREVHPEHGTRVWFQALVPMVATENGRPVSVPAPTVAWTWEDGTALADLPARLATGFQGVTVGGRPVEGYDSAEIDETIEAAAWLSRFFLAGAMWLRQRIVVPTPGEGTRPAGRRLQREHGLAERPKVQVIELRREERQMVQRAREAQAAEGDGTRRKLGVRFVVGGLFGFTRNQWHPSTGTHVPTWIAPFWKGPDDAPVKQTSRVYVVRR